MPETNKNITYFAETNFRNEKKKFGIKKKKKRDRPGICMLSENRRG